MTFYHVAALYEVLFLILSVELLVCTYLSELFSGNLFVLFIISLTTLESVIILSYLIYRSTKSKIATLRDSI